MVEYDQMGRGQTIARQLRSSAIICESERNPNSSIPLIASREANGVLHAQPHLMEREGGWIVWCEWWEGPVLSVCLCCNLAGSIPWRWERGDTWPLNSCSRTACSAASSAGRQEENQ